MVSVSVAASAPRTSALTLLLAPCPYGAFGQHDIQIRGVEGELGDDVVEMRARAASRCFSRSACSLREASIASSAWFNSSTKRLAVVLSFQCFQIFAIAVLVVGERLLLVGVLIDLGGSNINERGLGIDRRLQRLLQRRRVQACHR